MLVGQAVGASNLMQLLMECIKDVYSERDDVLQSVFGLLGE